MGSDHQVVNAHAACPAPVGRQLADLRQTAAALARLRHQERRATADRDTQVLVLAEAGIRYDDIAAAAGLTPGRVAQLVRRQRQAPA